jgi:hypothetical protein
MISSEDAIVILGSKLGFIVSNEEALDLILTGKNPSEIAAKIEKELKKEKDTKKKPLYESQFKSI